MTPAQFSGLLAYMARHWGNYRRKHKISKGNNLCISADTIDEFRVPNAKLSGRRRCYSRKGLYRDKKGHWRQIDGDGRFKQKRGKKGPYVHWSTL